jgi:hypothetical protein
MKSEKPALATQGAWAEHNACVLGVDGAEPFALANDPPKRKPWRAENEPARQKKLLDGLDCLPGQQDLFEGSEENS